jgi:transposase
MTSTSDPSGRRRALREQGLLNPAAAAVQDERFHDGDFFEPQDLVQVRYEMLRSVRTGERTASAAAARFGVSRATYYQAQAAFEREGVAGLLPGKRGPRGAHKLTGEVLDFALKQLQDDPGLNSSELAELIGERFHLSVHARSVERALERRKKKPHGPPP